MLRKARRQATARREDAYFWKMVAESWKERADSLSRENATIKRELEIIQFAHKTDSVCIEHGRKNLESCLEIISRLKEENARLMGL